MKSKGTSIFSKYGFFAPAGSRPRDTIRSGIIKIMYLCTGGAVSAGGTVLAPRSYPSEIRNKDIYVYMKDMKTLKILLAALCIPFAAAAEGPQVPSHVPNVEIITLANKASVLPDYGKKHMMIFYVDPDARGQNKEFQKELKKNQDKTASENIAGYAILNLADTKLPGGMVRDFAKIATSGTESINMADNDHTLRDAWKLGDVDDKFVLMFVTKDGEMIYYRAGEFSQKDIDEFYEILYKHK